MGVIQLINKDSNVPFDGIDVNIMNEACRILGRALSHIIHDTQTAKAHQKNQRSAAVAASSKEEPTLNVASVSKTVPFVLVVDNITNLVVHRIKRRIGGSRKQHFRVRIQLRHGMVVLAEESTKYTDIRPPDKEQLCDLEFENRVSIPNKRSSSVKKKSFMGKKRLTLGKKQTGITRKPSMSKMINKRTDSITTSKLTRDEEEINSDGLDDHGGVVRFQGMPLANLPHAGYIRVIVERALGTSEKKKAASTEIFCWGDAPIYDFRKTLIGSSHNSHIEIATWNGSPSTKFADIMHVNPLVSLTAEATLASPNFIPTAHVNIRLAIPKVFETIAIGEDINDPMVYQYHPRFTTDSSLRLMLSDVKTDPYENAKRDSMFVKKKSSLLSSSEPPLSVDLIKRLMQRCTALDDVTTEDKRMLWRHRHELASLGEQVISSSIGHSTLPAVLRAVDWTDSTHVNEIHHLLYRWDPQPSKIDALQLLDAQFADHKVRALGVQCLESMTDDEVRLYMIQLIQAIKFEQHTDSALSRFLLRRSLAQPTTVGRAFFWGLKAEMLGASKDGKEKTLTTEEQKEKEKGMKELRRNSVDRTSSMVATTTSLNEATIKTMVDSRGLVDENGETSFHVFAEHEEKRLKIIMGFYVRNCGTHRITLGLQMFMMQRFQSVQQSIKPLAVSVVLLFCCTFVLLYMA